MSAAQQFTKGDRVKVTLEGTVTGIVPFDDRVELCVEDDAGVRYFIAPRAGSVEKVEPPVEVFKPGSVVKNKFSGFTYAIGCGGFVALRPGGSWVSSDTAVFTSENYERTSVG